MIVGEPESLLPALQSLLSAFGPRDFAVRLWDGTQWPADVASPRFTVVFQSPETLQRILQGPLTDLSLGESYVNGDLDIEGDLERAMALAEHLICSVGRKERNGATCGRRARCAAGASGKMARGKVRPHGTVHSPARDRQAIAYHYNVSNGFYSLWLDRRMAYSCARFANPDEDLDVAQLRRMDDACHKLRLKPKQRLLDIGCGWGGLIVHAAGKFGVEALGITLSEPQAEIANRRARQSGLADRCRAIVCDYRGVQASNGFDKLVSIGMVEHVGKSQLGEYFQHAKRLLRVGGEFLLSGITQNATCPQAQGPTFITRYVFPDGELVPAYQLLCRAEEAGFEFRNAENLREHYAITLRRWVRQLQASHDQALRIVDESIYRIWRLYMAGSAHSFATGQLNVFETLLSKPS